MRTEQAMVIAKCLGELAEYPEIDERTRQLCVDAVIKGINRTSKILKDYFSDAEFRRLAEERSLPVPTKEH